MRALILAFFYIVLLVTGCKTNAPSEGAKVSNSLVARPDSYIRKGIEVNYPEPEGRSVALYIHGTTRPNSNRPEFINAKAWLDGGFDPYVFDWTSNSFDTDTFAEAATTKAWANVIPHIVDQFKALMNRYQGFKPEQELRIICHSLGCQIAAYLVHALAVQGEAEKMGFDPVSIRFEMLDLYDTGGLGIETDVYQFAVKQSEPMLREMLTDISTSAAGIPTNYEAGVRYASRKIEKVEYLKQTHTIRMQQYWLDTSALFQTLSISLIHYQHKMLLKAYFNSFNSPVPVVVGHGRQGFSAALPTRALRNHPLPMLLEHVGDMNTEKLSEMDFQLRSVSSCFAPKEKPVSTPPSNQLSVDEELEVLKKIKNSYCPTPKVAFSSVDFLKNKVEHQCSEFDLHSCADYMKYEGAALDEKAKTHLRFCKSPAYRCVSAVPFTNIQQVKIDYFRLAKPLSPNLLGEKADAFVSITKAFNYVLAFHDFYISDLKEKPTTVTQITTSKTRQFVAEWVETGPACGEIDLDNLYNRCMSTPAMCLEYESKGSKISLEEKKKCTKAKSIQCLGLKQWEPDERFSSEEWPAKKKELRLCRNSLLIITNPDRYIKDKEKLNLASKLVQIVKIRAQILEKYSDPNPKKKKG